MSLDEKQVENIAKLARLGLTDKEKKKFQKELSSILDFVEKLNKAETKGIEPMAQATGLNNVLREDKKRQKTKEETDKLVNLFPESQYLPQLPILHHDEI